MGVSTSRDKLDPREEFVQFANLLPEPMLLVTGDGAVLAANRSASTLSGFSAAELARRNLCDFVVQPFDVIAPLLRVWSRSNILLPGTLTIVGRDRRETPCRCEGAVFRPRSGAAPAVILVRLLRKAAAVNRFIALNQRIDQLTVEVSRRRRLQHALDAQREWLRVTLESIGDAVIATSTDGRITFMNTVASTLTGVGIEDALGRPLVDVFHIINEQSRAKVENPVSTVLRKGVTVGLANHTVLVRKDGTELPIDDSAAPIRGEDGELLGVVLVFHDITERRNLIRHLQERTEKLALADRHKDDFLAMLAHELRNPLAPLLSGSHILRSMMGDDARVLRIGDMMQRQIQHLSRLVDDLLDVSRITRGKIDFRRVPVSLRAALEQAVEMTRPLMDERKHELSVALPPESVYVEGDSTRLAQVFANLLENAGKYSEPGGRVSVRFESTDKTAAVHVRDKGIGIDPANLTKVFEIFAQADKSLDRPQGGLGLGLTVARSIVEMHRGTVEAHSRGLGKGSEFIVRLPMLRRDAADDPVGAPGVAPESQAPIARRVLVVDDNKDAAMSLAMLIRDWGHEVRCAHTGPDALSEGQAFRPELVLLDIGLPGMDGYEVARRLRRARETAEAMLVAVTGYGRDQDRSLSREAGFDEHLVKPVAPDVLQRLLSQAEN